MISMGRTRVLCTATVEDRIAPWLRGQKQGLGGPRVRRMLPRATSERTARTAQTGAIRSFDGRRAQHPGAAHRDHREPSHGGSRPARS